MRYDMGNHIQTLEHLVHNNMDDATEYLEHLKMNGDEVFQTKSRKSVIDVILMEK